MDDLAVALRKLTEVSEAVYALYSRNRYLLLFLGSLFLAELTSLCYILVVVTPRLTYNDECYVTSSPPVFQYYWCVACDLLAFSGRWSYS